MASLALRSSPVTPARRVPRRPKVIWPGGVALEAQRTPILLFDDTGSPGLHATPRKPSPMLRPFETPSDRSPWVHVLGLSRTPETPELSSLDLRQRSPSPPLLFDHSWPSELSQTMLWSAETSVEEEKGSESDEGSLKSSPRSVDDNLTSDGQAYCTDVGCEACQSSFFEDRPSLSHLSVSSPSSLSTPPPTESALSSAEPSPSTSTLKCLAPAFESTPPRLSNVDLLQGKAAPSPIRSKTLIQASPLSSEVFLRKGAKTTKPPLSRDDFRARLAPSFFGPDLAPRLTEQPVRPLVEAGQRKEGKTKRDLSSLPKPLPSRAAPLLPSQADAPKLPSEPLKRRTTSILRPMRFETPSPLIEGGLKPFSTSRRRDEELEGEPEGDDDDVELDLHLDLDVGLDFDVVMGDPARELGEENLPPRSTSASPAIKPSQLPKPTTTTTTTTTTQQQPKAYNLRPRPSSRLGVSAKVQVQFQSRPRPRLR